MDAGFPLIHANFAAASLSSVYRVFSQAGVLSPFQGKRSIKGTGYTQRLAPHEHWHIDVSYLNTCGTFCFRCSIWAGCSLAFAHWEICEKMQEIDVETIVQRGRLGTTKALAI